jgi:metal-responsive CopG/Arc/MetJ family transcriptional regulator
MERFMMSVSEEMYQELEKERKLRRLETVQEAARQIIGDYLKNRNGGQPHYRLLDRPQKKVQTER